MKQQPPEQKMKKAIFAIFWKMFLDQNTRKQQKLCTALWKLGSEKIVVKGTYFVITYRPY